MTTLAQTSRHTASLAPYMAWSKLRPAPQFDLAGSNLLHCDLADLPGALSGVALTGPNAEGYPALLEAIARRYGTTPDCVATASGAGGANFLAFAALVRAGDDVAVERPAYDPLLGALRLLGANIVRFDRRFEDGWSVDPERVRAALTPRTRLIVLTSPHNPSGALVPDESLDAIGAMAEAVRARVLVDEVYLDAVYRERPAPAFQRAPVFVSTSSLTKAFGLSGLRCGWVIGEPSVAEAARRARDVIDGVGPFAMDQLALTAFLQLDALEARARGILEPNLQTLTRFVEQRAELEWVAPRGGNVAFPRVRAATDTRDLARVALERHGTAIVPGHFFDAPAHIRLAFGCSAETLHGGLRGLAAALDSQ